MQKDLLAVSWQSGQIGFVSVKNGESVSSWEYDGSMVGLSIDSGGFVSILRQGVERTGYRGKNVAMVIDHPRMTQQLLETPPAKGSDLEMFIERQIDHLKCFEEDVTWSYQPTHDIKTSSGLIVFQLPTLIKTQLISNCREAGLHLLMLLPTTAVLTEFLPMLPIREGDIAMLASSSRDTTAIVIGRKRKPIFLSRSLHCSWNQNSDRVASEINRSIVFFRQQFGEELSSMWLVGKGADRESNKMQSTTKVPIQFSGTEITSCSWAEHAAKLPADTHSNLIDKEERLAPRRRMMVMLSSVVLGMILSASFAVYGWIEWELKQQRDVLASLEPEKVILEKKKQNLKNRYADLEQRKKFINLVDESRLPPVPGWFYTYLGEVLPKELLLTKLQITRDDELTESDDKKKKAAADMGKKWLVRIEGGADPAAVDSLGLGVRDLFNEFVEQLSSGPYHLNVTDRTKSFTPRSENPTGWKVTGTGAGKGGHNQFFLEGILREEGDS